ncbi:MAG: hypothetical protein Q8Q48_02325 [Candidatus Staskawiczbacteria bacterium]|nr:hypothetical protein [Candidatus Staskawiczbacteria bacterium]
MGDSNPAFNFLAVDIGVFYFNGRKYLNCAKKLFEENNAEESLVPFCLLASTAAEIFLKIIIAVNICENLKDLEKNNSNTKEIVNEELKNCGHDIKKMVEKSGVKDQFKITQLEEVSNEFVSDYRFLQNGKPIFLKNSESIRFASLAKKPDVTQSVQYHFSPQIVDFLEQLKNFAEQRTTFVIGLYKEDKN